MYNGGKGDYACCLCAIPVFHMNDFKIGEVYGWQQKHKHFFSNI